MIFNRYSLKHFRVPARPNKIDTPLGLERVNSSQSWSNTDATRYEDLVICKIVIVKKIRMKQSKLERKE